MGSEGPLQRWNSSNATFDLQVQPTDYIVEANGVRGTSVQLLEEIQGSSTQLDLVLKRNQQLVPLPHVLSELAEQLPIWSDCGDEQHQNNCQSSSSNALDSTDVCTIEM